MMLVDDRTPIKHSHFRLFHHVCMYITEMICNHVLMYWLLLDLIPGPIQHCDQATWCTLVAVNHHADMGTSNIIDGLGQQFCKSIDCSPTFRVSCPRSIHVISVLKSLLLERLKAVLHQAFFIKCHVSTSPKSLDFV